MLFYAVAVFMSFLAGLASRAVFSHREGLRGLPLFSVAASLAVAGIFYWMWVRAGKPSGLHGHAKALEAGGQP